MLEDLAFALGQQEKAQSMLENMERLKAQGTVDEQQYQSLKMDYVRRLNEAIAHVQSARQRIQARLSEAQEQLAQLEKERLEWELRFRVGEIDQVRYNAEKERITSQQVQLQSEIDLLIKALAAQKSIDVPEAPPNPEPSRQELPRPPEPVTAWSVWDRLTSFLAKQAHAIPIPVASARQFALGGAIAMFIAIFLPVYSAPFFGSVTFLNVKPFMEFSEANGPGSLVALLGFVTMFASLVAGGLYFLPQGAPIKLSKFGGFQMEVLLEFISKPHPVKRLGIEQSILAR